VWTRNVLDGMAKIERDRTGYDSGDYAEVINDDARRDAEPTDWLSTDHSMELHTPFACPVCGGTVIWFDGDGYRCRQCDQPCNPDGTPYKEVAK